MVAKESLHICFVTKNAPATTGPSEQGHILPMARQIIRLGHKVTILTWKTSMSEEEKYTEENIDVLFLGVGHYKTIKEFPSIVNEKLYEIHKDNAIDIVHSLDTPLNLINKNYRKPPFAISYGVEATSMLEVFAKFSKTYSTDWSAWSALFKSSVWFLQKYIFEDFKILKQADGIFVASPKQSIALDRYYLYPSLRTYQIPIGLATGFFPKRDKSAELMESLDLDYKSQVVVARNDMEDLSEMTFLLDAFEKVAIKKPRAHLIIIGDGPYLKQAERHSLDLALADRVHFVGQLPRKKYVDYIALGDIFIQLNARTSGVGQSLFEAMAQEKVVIGSEFSPISYFIEDQTEGYLIRPGEQEKLTHLIIKVFERGDEFKEIGQNARAKIIQNFDRKTLANHACQAFQKIITNKK